MLRLRKAGLIAVVLHILALIALVVYLVLAIIHATHSDVDISEFIKRLLPAGNCLCDSNTVFDCKLSIQAAKASSVALAMQSTDAHQGDWKFDYARDSLDSGLTHDQCTTAFPGFFEEVYRAVEVRHKSKSNISVDDLDDIELSRGMVRAMIVDRKLRVLETKQVFEDHRKKALAILYAMQRSIPMDGRPTPNIEFIFSVEDFALNPAQPIWTLARRPQDHNLWLIPDFGFWSWDLPDLGTLGDVVDQVIRDEASTEWNMKIPKLVWRGKPQMLPKLRRSLLDATAGKPWSDVEGLIPGPSAVPENYLSAADQCKYMFIAHAEGNGILERFGYGVDPKILQVEVTRDR